MKPKRIFVACYHSYIDTSSVAAISLRDMMEALAGNGWAVRVLSGPKLDFEGAKTNQDLLREQGIDHSTYRASCGGQTVSLSPFLIVESRASTHWLAESGADLSAANLYRMRNTPDPRDYLRRTRLLLVPSVWQESFGRVAAEAMMNGSPVIGSNRGALPEVIGDPSLLFELPAWITPDSNRLPTRNEVSPWVERETS